MFKKIPKNFFLLLLILLLLHSLAFNTPKIRNIIIHQPYTAISTDYLLKSIIFLKNSIYSNQTIDEAFSKLNQLFQNECYFDVKIYLDSIATTIDTSSVDIFITIIPEEQYKIDKIFIVGNTHFNLDELMTLMETKSGTCLNKNLLETDIENILSLYENNGFPLTTIKINNIQINDSTKTFTVEIEIDEKGRAKIEQIKIDGNKETRSNIIIRELRIKPGEIYNHKKFKKITSRLYKMQLFDNIEDPILYLINTPNDDKHNTNISSNKENFISTGILIKLTEGNTNFFDGVIGYLPGNLDEKGYFIGTAEISMRNLFGTARKLNFRWSKDEKFSQEIGIRYTEPWLLNYPVNLKSYFYQRKQDTIYIKRYGELKMEFMISELLSASTILSQDNIINSNPQFITQISNSGTFALGLEVNYDTRDYVYNPTNGIYFRNDYFYGRKKLYSLSQSISLQRYSFDLEIYKLIFTKQVMMFGIHGKHLNSSKIEISDMYRLGGTFSLRGYRENQFLGSRVYWTNFEYRFLIGKRSFFYGFFDTGYYFRKDPNTQEKSEAFKFGYGVGMRVQTKLGIIGVSLALGRGDILSQTKIHFGLINEF